MARPNKQGLDYFSFDVDFFEDEKIEAISGEFGIKGEIATIKLLCAVYRNGYFILWSDMLKMKLLKNLPGISSELLDAILNRLVVWDFFDKSLFDSVGVLTSKGIQRRFFEATKRRQISENLPYILINADNNEVNAYNNSSRGELLHTKTTQSKVKKSKVKKNIPPTIPHVETRDVFEKFKDEMLSDDFWVEQQAMTSGIGNKFTNVVSIALEKFFSWIVSTGNEETIKTLNDAKRRFFYWWRDHGKPEFEKEHPSIGVDTSRIALGIGVWIDGGKKFYGSRENPREIPLNAPYRPAQDAKWDATNERWTISGG